MIPVVKDDPTAIVIEGDTCLIGSYDKNIYKINLREELLLSWDRIRMDEEDKESTTYSNFVNAQLKSGKKIKAPTKAAAKEDPKKTKK